MRINFRRNYDCSGRSSSFLLSIYKALLCLLEVDNIPNGLEIIDFDVLVLEVERVLPNINTNDRSVGYEPSR